MPRFIPIFSWLWLCASAPLSAATYYLATAGDDAQDGLSPQTAWRTLEQASNASLADGDTLLLRRGDVFRGELNPRKTYTDLTYGAYGEGARPVIAGSIALGDWQPSALGAGIFQTSVAGRLPEDGRVVHLFAGENLQTIARFPNVDSPADKNWLTVGVKGSNGFGDPVLAARGNPDGYWTGATLRIRDYSWTFTVRPVTGYTAASGRLDVADLGSQLPDWGYFLDGKLEELDHPGEWFYQAETQTVYFYPPAGMDPNTALIEGSVYDTGLLINNHDDRATVENLVFRHFTAQGIHVNSSSHATIKNCHFEHNPAGVSVWNAAALQVVHNTFNHHFKNSIQLNAAKDFDVLGATVANNLVLNSAMYPAYGERDKGVYNGIGINLFGQGQTARNNVVKNTSWVGINIQGNGHHVVEGNVVMDTLLVLNDGGSLFVISEPNQIKNNILLNAWGNIDESNGCASSSTLPCSKHGAYGMGIGSNPKYSGIEIEGNVIAHNRDMGIRFNSFSQSTVIDNLLVDNDPGIVLQDKSGPSTGNQISHNQIVSLHPDQIGLSLTNNTEHGGFFNNRYCNPFSELAIERDYQRYGVVHWHQTFPNLGENSTDCGWQYPEFQTTPMGEEMIANGEFTDGIEGWNPSYDPQRLFHETSRAEMDGASLRVQHPGDDKRLNISPGSFTIQQGQWYRLGFSLLADGYGDLRIAGNQTKPEYVILQDRYFALTPGRRDYEWVFRSEDTTEFFKLLAFLDPEDTPQFWLDNVSLTPVAATRLKPTTFTRLWLNLTAESRNFSLGETQYQDLAGQSLQNQLTLPAYSARLLGYAGGAIPVPTPPNLWLMQAGNEVTIFWNQVMDAEGYRLYYAPYPNPESIGQVDLGLRTQFSAPLPNGAAFYIAISAYNSHGESEISNIRWFAVP